ncbi:MAG: glycoside hydrolase family 2 TIM barrel-domain containing protein [Rikenellaceae bacterium]
MKKSNNVHRCSVMMLAAALLCWSCVVAPQEEPRSRVSIDMDWRFALGDAEGAECVEYDDTEWRELCLPHDWSIEGEYDEANPSGIAGGFLPTGIGWYRKVLTLSPSADKRYYVEFDGVYMNSDVWINGEHLGKRPYGYISFAYDLTPHLHDGDNTIAVRVDHSKTPSGRWYTGSGIYRHVWLTTTNMVHVAQWGSSVTTPVVGRDRASVELGLEVVNPTSRCGELQCKSNIVDRDGAVVATSSTATILVGGMTNVGQTFEIESPQLWSPDNPYVYTVVSDLYLDDQWVDRYETPLGVRFVDVRGSQGLFLNGESIKLKGLSNHHDAGAVGTAVPNDVLYRRLKLLKDMGCNALRTTHNPFAPEFYAMCDTMGFMVLDEAFDGWFDTKAEFDYGLYFEEWWRRDLSDFIRRDRNHPSVIMWSIGNEVHGFTGDQQKMISDFVRSIDNSRAITQGRGYMYPHIDISGFNGHGEMRGVLESHHEQYPERAIIGTEITHTLQSRGVYRTRTWYRVKDNPAPWEHPSQFPQLEPLIYKIPHLKEEEFFDGVDKCYQSSYDNSIVRIGVRDDWNRVEELDYYIGNFRWTGFDYIGESFAYPARTTDFGIIDLCGFPKDHYYLYQSLWSDEPMVHLLPHWTHPGREGVVVPVVVYTNCGAAELFLNGRSLGKQTMGRERQLVWNVAYEPGTITAVAYSDSGERLAKSYTTAGEAAAVQLTLDKSVVRANGRDVIHCEASIVDKDGVMLPNADHLIHFTLSDNARNIGVENGDVMDLAPHKVDSRKAFSGKALLMVQSTREGGDITIRAEVDGLSAAEVVVDVMEVE